MHRWAALIVVCLSVLAGLGERNSQAAITSNDLIANAILIESSPATFQINTLGYNSTAFPGDPPVGCGGQIDDAPYRQTRTAWFKFVPETAGAFTAETANTVVDTVIVLWEYHADEADPFVEVRCNDDNLIPSPRPATSRIPGVTGQAEPQLTAGTTYYLEVMSYGNTVGGQMDVQVTYSGVIAPHPVPQMTSVAPAGVAAGSGATALVVQGTGFTGASKVVAGTTELTPSAVTQTSLTVTLPGTLLADPADIAIQVTNPAPGGGSSNVLPLFVYSPPSIVSAGPLFPVAGSGDLSLALIGTGFRSGMTTATVAGIPRALTVESATSATLNLLAADLASPGTRSIVLTNSLAGGPALPASPYVLTVRHRLDLNCSGSVTAEDALFLMRLIAGIGQPEPGCPLPLDSSELEMRSVLGIRRQVIAGP